MTRLQTVLSLTLLFATTRTAHGQDPKLLSISVRLGVATGEFSKQMDTQLRQAGYADSGPGDGIGCFISAVFGGECPPEAYPQKHGGGLQVDVVAERIIKPHWAVAGGISAGDLGGAKGYKATRASYLDAYWHQTTLYATTRYAGKGAFAGAGLGYFSFSSTGANAAHVGAILEGGVRTQGRLFWEIMGRMNLVPSADVTYQTGAVLHTAFTHSVLSLGAGLRP